MASPYSDRGWETCRQSSRLQWVGRLSGYPDMPLPGTSGSQYVRVSFPRLQGKAPIPERHHAACVHSPPSGFQRFSRMRNSSSTGYASPCPRQGLCRGLPSLLRTLRLRPSDHRLAQDHPVGHVAGLVSSCRFSFDSQQLFSWRRLGCRQRQTACGSRTTTAPAASAVRPAGLVLAGKGGAAHRPVLSWATRHSSQETGRLQPDVLDAPKANG